MPTRASNFFVSTVRPTATEFLNDIRDVRRGRLAAIVLFHMADYWVLENPVAGQSLKAFCTGLANECPDFALIRDVANASKHDRLTSEQKPPLQVSSAEQIARPPGIFGAPFGVGVFGEASIVMVTLDDHTQKPLIGPVRSVLAMWEIKLGLAAVTDN